MEHRVYPAKVLLFGEYSVLFGGEALAIPWKSQFAHWDKGNFHQSAQFLDLYYYLYSQNTDFLDLNKFYYAIQEGWYLKSNIIQGYGLGSSGSITAAIYDKFKKKKNEENLNILRVFFSKIESFYHGHSSGFDPMIAYFGKVIHMQDSNPKCYPDSRMDLSNFFLIDSKISRSKDQWVSDTFTKLKADNQLRKSFVELQNSAIRSLTKDNNQLQNDFIRISEFQIRYLKELIPDGLVKWWKEGIRSGNYCLKLCGAGGGGYYLGYTLNFDMLDHLRRDYSVTRI